MEKDPLFVELGRRGGKATYKKLGKRHYKIMSEKGRKVLMKKLFNKEDKESL